MTELPIAVLGIDLGKCSCSLAGMDVVGTRVRRKRKTRDADASFTNVLATGRAKRSR